MLAASLYINIICMPCLCAALCSVDLLVHTGDLLLISRRPSCRLLLLTGIPFSGKGPSISYCVQHPILFCVFSKVIPLFCFLHRLFFLFSILGPLGIYNFWETEFAVWFSDFIYRDYLISYGEQIEKSIDNTGQTAVGLHFNTFICSFSLAVALIMHEESSKKKCLKTLWLKYCLKCCCIKLCCLRALFTHSRCQLH